MADNAPADRGSGDSERHAAGYPRKRKPTLASWILEHEWYKLVTASVALAGALIGVVVGFRELWPDPGPSKPSPQNYALLLDRSSSMGDTVASATRLELAQDALRDNIERFAAMERAQGFWDFGASCEDGVRRLERIRSGNKDAILGALRDVGEPAGARPLVAALNAAIDDLAEIPATYASDVRTIRRVLVVTGGTDTCGGDITTVTSRLGAGADDPARIELQFQVIAVDVADEEREPLERLVAQLPGLEGEPAQATFVEATGLTAAVNAAIGGGEACRQKRELTSVMDSSIGRINTASRAIDAEDRDNFRTSYREAEQAVRDAHAERAKLVVADDDELLVRLARSVDENLSSQDRQLELLGDRADVSDETASIRIVHDRWEAEIKAYNDRVDDIDALFRELVERREC